MSRFFFFVLFFSTHNLLADFNGEWTVKGHGARMRPEYKFKIYNDCSTTLSIQHSTTSLSLKRDTKCSGEHSSFTDGDEVELQIKDGKLLCNACTENEVGSITNTFFEFTSLRKDPKYALRSTYYFDLATKRFSFTLQPGRSSGWGGFIQGVTGDIQ